MAADLKSQLVLLVNDGKCNILLDLASCKNCDSSGLSALLLGNRLCDEADGKFFLVGVNNEIQEMIKLAGLEQYLTIVGTDQEAESQLM